MLRTLSQNLLQFKRSIANKHWSLSDNKNLKIGTESDQKKKKKEFENKKIDTLIWLDDRIDPLESRMDWLSYSPIGKNVNVIWVKNYIDFIDWIQNNGLPDAICFDYDLGETKNGYDCAKWLIDYCKHYHLHPPLWTSQSIDLIGKTKINRLLKNFVSSI